MGTFPFDTNKLIEICRQNDVTKIGVFGSMARGEATDRSDVDLLVYFSKPKSLLSFVALKRKLTMALGMPVDLFTETDISPYIRDRVKRELRIVYETA